MNKENYEDLYYLALETDVSGKDGHPVSEIGHTKAAQTIINYIEARGII